VRPDSETASYVVGLIGADIGPSFSPSLHEREATELGLRYVYERIDIKELGVAPEGVGELLRRAQRTGFRGVNVTHPCKQTVVEHLSDLSSDAATLGAVNTVVFEDGNAVGHNTDWPGFQQSFARGLPDVATSRVVLLGAGGAGAAVAHAALSLGIERLSVVDTDLNRADVLARSLRRRYGDDRAVVPARLSAELPRADGLINATPTGMATHPGAPLPLELLHDRLWVADVVYRPLETELLRHARHLGCRTLDGGGMAVFQAALSFELFTGRKPDRERMLRHFALLAEDAPSPVAR